MNLRTVVALAALLLCGALLSCGNSRNTQAADAGAADSALHAPVLAPEPQSHLHPEDLSHSIAAGATFPVELKAVIDSTNEIQQFVWARVTDDVRGSDGRVAVPAGSKATILVRKSGRTGAISTVDLGLYSVNVLGQQYSLTLGAREPASIRFTEDAGKGLTHSSVHLEYGSHMDFKLESAVQLR